MWQLTCRHSTPCWWGTGCQLQSWCSAAQARSPAHTDCFMHELFTKTKNKNDPLGAALHRLCKRCMLAAPASGNVKIQAAASEKTAKETMHDLQLQCCCPHRAAAEHTVGLSGCLTDPSKPLHQQHFLSSRGHSGCIRKPATVMTLSDCGRSQRTDTIELTTNRACNSWANSSDQCGISAAADLQDCWNQESSM